MTNDTPDGILVKMFHGDEARRFYVSGYDDLMSEIEDLFGVTKEAAVLQYVDKDGDVITMRKPGEYRAALTSLKDNEIVFTLVNKDEPKKWCVEFAVRANRHIVHVVPVPLILWPSPEKVRSHVVRSKNLPTDFSVTLSKGSTEEGIVAKFAFKSPAEAVKMSAIVRFSSQTGLQVPVVLDVTIPMKAENTSSRTTRQDCSSSSSSSASSSSSSSSSSSRTTPSTICLSDIPFVEGIPLGTPEARP